MIDAMKQAERSLSELELFVRALGIDSAPAKAAAEDGRTAITALRAAIEAAERQRPYGYAARMKTPMRNATSLLHGYILKTKEEALEVSRRWSEDRIFNSIVGRQFDIVELHAHPPAITADMVEKAAKTLADLNYPVSGWPSGFDAAFQAHFRKHARAALEAALGVKHV